MCVRRGNLWQKTAQSAETKGAPVGYKAEQPFEEQRARLVAEQSQGAHPKDPDEYRAANVLWLLPETRWARLQQNARQVTIGQIVDEAMNKRPLQGVLPRDCAPLIDGIPIPQVTPPLRER